MMDINKTLCKQCPTCRDYVYERYDKKGVPIMFQYCEGNKEYVDLSNWYITKDGYAYSTKKIDGKKRLFHTLFKKEETQVIDHIDGFRNDNRLRKLREITPLCNAQNNHYVKKTSEYVGVHWNKAHKRWVACSHRGKQGKGGTYHFGYFKTEEEAYDAYVRGLKAVGKTVNTQLPCHKKYLKWLSEKSQVTLEAFQ